MDDTSTILLEQLRSDASDEAWERFVSLYEPSLRRWLLQGGIRGPDVDDLFQEVMAILVEHVPKFQSNGRRGAFRSWLRILVRHRVLAFHRTQHRRQQRHCSVVLEDLADANCHLSQRWDREHDRRVVREVLRRMESHFTKPTWRAFRRQVIDGIPARQVALELGISPNSAIIAKSRVLARIRSEAAGFQD
jgi:RNA polymerase sigma-70 factor (ECF subfamily)